MHYSLNETEALCRKAARGAGLAWGLAEEAGKTARWLATHDLPGPALLGVLLAQNDGLPYENLAPLTVDERWRAPAGCLCPLITGAALADRAATFDAGQVIEFVALSYPLLLLPQAGVVAARLGMAVELRWAGARLTVNARQGLAVVAEAGALALGQADVRCAVGVADEECQPPIHRPIVMEREVVQQLELLAGRTYAPSSEASRLLGAGAGVQSSE